MMKLIFVIFIFRICVSFEYFESDEFQVNVQTSPNQELPHVANLGNNCFIVVWASNGTEGVANPNEMGIAGRVYEYDSSLGKNLLSPGFEFTVNVETQTRTQSDPVVCKSGDNFMVFWTSIDAGVNVGIFGQIFEFVGNTPTPLFSEFSVNTFTPDDQFEPHCTSLVGGNVLVSWTSKFQDANGRGVYGQIINSVGGKEYGEFQIHQVETSDQKSPRVVGLSTGGFFAVWERYNITASKYEISGRVFHSNTNPLTSELQISPVDLNIYRFPTIDFLDNGKVIITWQRYINPPTYNIVCRVYDESGNPLTQVIVVNTYQISLQIEPKVSKLDTSRFVVIWGSYGQDGSSFGVYGQVMDASLAIPTKEGSVFRVNSYTPGNQMKTSVRVIDTNGFVVVWTSPRDELEGTGVFGKVFIEEWYCYSKSTLDVDVCSQLKGDCVSPNNCQCNTGYYGDTCDTSYFCWDRYSYDVGVCSYHGTCIDINTCSCTSNYYGNRCQHFKCNNIDHRETLSCWGDFGNCIDHNTCQCDAGFSVCPHANDLTGGCACCDSTKCSGVGDCTVLWDSNDYSCANCGDNISGSRCEVCTVNGKVGVQMNGYCYYSFPGVHRDWQGARDYCKANFHPASDLPIINDPRAQSAVHSATGSHRAWIGYSDGASDGDWKWLDDSNPIYSNWNLNSPDHGGDCAYIHGNGKWLNYHCMNSISMNAVTCGLDLSDEPSLTSSNELLNVGYKKYDFAVSSGYCDFTQVPENCPDDYKKCNGVDEALPTVCSSNGTCLFDANKKENYCSCNAGREGLDCELEDKLIAGLNCEGINGYCYYFFDIKKKWNVAREYCKSQWSPAADLAVIRSVDVQEKVQALVGTNDAWIGALDFVEGTIKWVDHSSVSYNNWYQKDNGGQFGEDCVEMRSSYNPFKSRWATSNCAVKKRFVCELKIDEASLSFSNREWNNVRYSKLNTGAASCSCGHLAGGPCPSCGCENPCPT